MQKYEIHIVVSKIILWFQIEQQLQPSIFVHLDFLQNFPSSTSLHCFPIP
uniref:Uncharacterized protein n=1 Tax=Arundo donax TaxID=35708 RepID=A0A0A9ALD5_ARUDO